MHLDAVQPKLRGMWIDWAEEDDGGGIGHVAARLKYKSVILTYKVTNGSSTTYIVKITIVYLVLKGIWFHNVEISFVRSL